MSNFKDFHEEEEISPPRAKKKKPDPAPSNEGRDPSWPEGYNGRPKYRCLNDGHDYRDFFTEDGKLK